MTSGKFLNKIQQSVGKKGSENTEELSKALMEELNCETAFTIPVFGGIPIAESVVVTWIIMAVLMIIMSVFPQIVYWITGKMGMMSPANVVYLFIIAILLIKTFMMTIELSSLENKFKDLTQQIAINEKQAADEKKETIGDKNGTD